MQYFGSYRNSMAESGAISERPLLWYAARPIAQEPTSRDRIVRLTSVDPTGCGAGRTMTAVMYKIPRPWAGYFIQRAALDALTSLPPGTPGAPCGCLARSSPHHPVDKFRFAKFIWKGLEQARGSGGLRQSARRRSIVTRMGGRAREPRQAHRHSAQRARRCASPAAGPRKERPVWSATDARDSRDRSPRHPGT